jgi:predicted TIM-barrel enzyme
LKEISSREISEIDIYIKGGVDAIIIENYFSNIGRVKSIEK